MAETVKIPPTIVVRDLAAKLGLPITTVSAELIKNGVMASLNQEIDFDTASIIAEDLGKKVELSAAPVEQPAASADSIETYLKEDPSAPLITRAPVVVVMGHVDHGKTSLLDAIRETHVTAGEAGGITQHIGAYQITKQNRLITFIDTPGHEAFTQMRTRGAKIADVAVVVVAADDGVKPQTKEVLGIIRQTGIPFIIAITKIDKPDSNAEKVKKELADENVLTEAWGGKVPLVEVSAKQKTGLSELLESVLLLADVESEGLKVNPDRPAIGTIIESHVDPQQGPVASVLVHTGTLRVGDDAIVGQVFGKIRSLKTDRGELVKSATPSMPVQILGLKAAPQVGDILRVAPDEVKELKKKVRSHQIVHHLQTVVGQRPTTFQKKNSDGEVDDTQPRVQKLFVILKTDTVGSAEAIIESLKKIQHPEVAVEVIQRGLGLVTEADVMRAEGSKATIYAFHAQVSPKAEHLARSKNLTVKSFKVIYDLLDDVKRELELLLPEQRTEREIGRLKVLAIFRNENTFQVVGGKVLSGEIQMNSQVKVMRRNETVTAGTITQLQQNKKDTRIVTEGNECGLKIEAKPLIQVGDEVVASVTTVEKRTLASSATA